MSGSQRRVSRRMCVLLALGFVFLNHGRAATQSSPWTGIAANDARSPYFGYPATPWSEITRGALTPDGRFLVFALGELGQDGEPNGNYATEVYLRDRVSGVVEPASIDDNGWFRAAREAVISDDGRHVAWGRADSIPHDLYVYDRVLGTAANVNVPPDGGGSPFVAYGMSISGDGRFVAFVGDFTWTSNHPHSAWLRDRDGDGDGVFDEPGESTTTEISPPFDPYGTVWGVSETAISPDGRYVAYIANKYDPNGMESWGKRVFLHDRVSGTAVQADAPAISFGSWGEARGLHFSNAGHLVYTSSDDFIVDNDGTGGFDAYVYDIASAVNTRVVVNHPGAPQYLDFQKPAISGDGRYVTVIGVEWQPSGSLHNVYAFDRQTNTSYDVSVNPDGARNNAARSVTINGDGSAIAFSATSDVLARPTEGLGVYVATAFSLTGGATSVPSAGGTYTVTLDAPAHTSWTVEVEGNVSVTPESGVGSATLEVTIYPNSTTEPVVSNLFVGSRKVSFHQVGLDVTPPVIMPTISGTLGENDWYTSDVSVTWSAEDPESAITQMDCPEYHLTSDTWGESASCTATSAGGTHVEYVAIRRDATPPTIAIQQPQPQTYTLNQQVALDYSCDDERLELCDGSQPYPNLETASAGTFVFSVTAKDFAGNTTTSSVTYTVKSATTLDAQPASGVHGGTATLSASLSSGGVTLVGRTVAFFIDNESAGSAVTSASGAASLPVDLSSRNFGSYAVRAEYAGDASTLASDDTSTLIVEKATPQITWAAPAAIVYGTPLSNVQLNATVTPTLGGKFVYSPSSGAVLGAGTHTLSVTFMHSDENYNNGTGSVVIEVTKATPMIAWGDPAPITYGTALGATQLNAATNVAGTFAYSPAAGAVLGAGTHTLSVTVTPNDTANYESASDSVSLVVGRATPAITWSDPASVVYGTALGAAQLNATSNVAGSFAYTPAAGTVLGAGMHALSVTFTPDDAANYESAGDSASLVVGKATPAITWSDPASVVYGTALGAAQLDATSNVAGSIVYTPAAGTVLGAGTHALSVTFTPDDAANYERAVDAASLVVGKATPVITWSNPSAIAYGTALGGTQLNAAANVAGSFVYTPPAGTVLGAGTHALATTFTPADAANYNNATAGRSITVNPVPLTVATNNATKVYGQALPAFTISGTGFVNGDTMASLSGTPSFSTSATATSAPGTYAVTPSGVSSPNYTITFAAGTLTVTKANTALVLTTTPNPSNHNQTVQLQAVVSAVAPGAGTATGTVEFRENGTLLGTATLVNGVATLNKSFKRGTHPLTATYAGNANFNGSSGTRTHQTN